MKKRASKNGSKKVPGQSQTGHLFQCQEAPGDTTRVRVFEQETIVRAAVQALFEIISEKMNWIRTGLKMSWLLKR